MFFIFSFFQVIYKTLAQLNNLQVELLSQKSRINGNSFNETLADFTNFPENHLIYSFLEDSFCPNNFKELITPASGFKKKLKKTISCDIKRFNQSKNHPFLTEKPINYSREKAINQNTPRMANVENCSNTIKTITPKIVIELLELFNKPF